MKYARLFCACAPVLSVLLLSSAPAAADVKTREKGHVKFEGMLGTMMRMFGGKAASDGLVSTNAVKGDRKATINDTTGRIVDLREEKVYDLDIKKKEYRVTTFDELRRRLKEAQDRAAQQAAQQAKEAPKEGADPAKTDGKEIEVDFDMKETGQTRSIAGHEARQVIMTITVREKGKTLDEGGGLVVTSDSWLGPDIPALKELAEFEMRYWKAIAPETATISAEQMAAVMAIYPMIKQALDKLNQEKVNLKGTPLSTMLTFEGVKSKAQIEQEKQSGGGGGIGGMLARRIAKKNDSPRSTIFTASTETLEISTEVGGGDIDIPAGFKLKN